MTAQNGPERRRGQAIEAGVERTLSGFASLRRVLWGHLGAHALTIATIAALIGAALLVLSKFLDVVHFVDQNGALLPGAGATHRGTGAMVLIGVSAGAAALAARWAEHSLPAVACAALGAIALGMVLLGDLPDVTSSGITRGTLIGEANPGAGFWVELAGALVTLVAGLALARLLTVARSAGS